MSRVALGRAVSGLAIALIAFGCALLLAGVVLLMTWSGTIPEESIRPTAIPPSYLAPLNLAGTLTLAVGLLLAALLLFLPTEAASSDSA